MDIPESMIPELNPYGIESPDRGICEDTAENRRILRRNGFSWQIIYEDDGSVSPNILAISPEMLTYRNTETLTRRSDLLSDPRNQDSDYLTGLDMILVPDVEDMVPAWVMASAQRWNQVEIQRENTGKNIEPGMVGPPGRCRHIKADGHRCMFWHNAYSGTGVCRVHMGGNKNKTDTPAMLVERARTRVMQASIAATEVLEHLAEKAENENVRLNAANSILDRAGVRGGVEINSTIDVSVKSAEVILKERLAKLQEVADRRALAELENTEDAEEVTE